MEVEPFWSRARFAPACGVLALVLAATSLGCGEPSSAVGLADAIAPHEPTIERFTHWAERTTLAVRAREHERLEETLFSVIREEDGLLVVVVERGGLSPLRVIHPRDAVVPSLSWQTVRTRTLGLVEAAYDPGDATHVWTRLAAHDDDGLTLVFELQSVSSVNVAPATSPR